MNFSAVGVRSPLKDYELAYWLNVQYGMRLVCRPDPEDEWENDVVWEYNVFDGSDPFGESLCMVANLSSGAQLETVEAPSLFDSVPEKHLLPSVKHWDYGFNGGKCGLCVRFRNCFKTKRKNHNGPIF